MYMYVLFKYVCAFTFAKNFAINNYCNNDQLYIYIVINIVFKQENLIHVVKYIKIQVICYNIVKLYVT